MAIAVKELTEVDRVSDAAIAAYHAAGDEAIEVQVAELVDLPIGRARTLRALLAGDARRVEIILDTEVDAGELAAITWRLAGSGWSVVVLVACNRLGDAHPALRGAPCALQPWWLDGAEVFFGREEIP